MGFDHAGCMTDCIVIQSSLFMNNCIIVGGRLRLFGSCASRLTCQPDACLCCQPDSSQESGTVTDKGVVDGLLMGGP